METTTTEVYCDRLWQKNVFLSVPNKQQNCGKDVILFDDSSHFGVHVVHNILPLYAIRFPWLAMKSCWGLTL